MRLRHLVVDSSTMGARRRRGLLVLAPAIALITALGACSSASNTPQGGGDQTLTGDCAKFQPYAGHAGTKVSMFASIISPESDSMQKSWDEFSKCTGITIVYEGANDFEAQLPVRVQGGTAPDLAIIPQPGLLAQIGEDRQGGQAQRRHGRQCGQVLEQVVEGVRHGQRDVLLRPDERQHEVPRLVLAEGVHRGRLQGSEHLGRDDDAQRHHRGDR